MYDEILRNVQSLKHFSYTPVQHISEAFNMVMLVCFSINVDHPEIENYFMLRDVIEGNKTSALESLYFMPWDAEQQPADQSRFAKRFDALTRSARESRSGCRMIIQPMTNTVIWLRLFRLLHPMIMTMWEVGKFQPPTVPF